MTPQMKAFLLELADLLEKYDVSVEATETLGYDSYCDGIEFSMAGKWDGEGNNLVEYSDFKVSRTPDQDELRRKANS